MEICIDEISEIDSQNAALSRDYTLNKTIASGSFGVVKSAIQKTTGHDVAIKIIEKIHSPASALTKTKQEANILKKLSHPNVIKFISTEETNSKLYIITELLKGGTLKSYIDNNIESLSEEKSIQILFYLLQAVNYIHNKDIVHRDIKPDNIMFADKNDLSTLKLVDFGLSGFTYETSSFCGTLLFMAPELLEASSSNASISNQKGCDIWSVGIIAAMLLNNGKHPYFVKGESKRKYINKLKAGYTFNRTLSEMSNNFIGKLLEPNPNKRYTAMNALNHPWITRNVLGVIPLTLYEKLTKKILVNKFKDAFIAMLMLNRMRSKKEKKFIIGKEYIDNMKDVEKEQRDMFYIKRQRSFKKNENNPIEKEEKSDNTSNTISNITVTKVQSTNNATSSVSLKKKKIKLLVLKPIPQYTRQKHIPSNSKIPYISYGNKERNDNKAIKSASKSITKIETSITVSSQQSTKSQNSPIKFHSKLAQSQAYSLSPVKHHTHVINIDTSNSSSSSNIRTNQYHRSNKSTSSFPSIIDNVITQRGNNKFKLQIMDLKIQSVVLPKISNNSYKSRNSKIN